jgi:hypothetical protein
LDFPLQRLKFSAFCQSGRTQRELQQSVTDFTCHGFKRKAHAVSPLSKHYGYVPNCVYRSNLNVPHNRSLLIVNKPNVLVEWVTLLLRFPELPGSNLGLEPAILTEVFRGFPQYL